MLADVERVDPDRLGEETLSPVVVVSGGRAGLDPIAIPIKELPLLGSFTYADEFASVIARLAVRARKTS